MNPFLVALFILGISLLTATFGAVFMHRKKEKKLIEEFKKRG